MMMNNVWLLWQFVLLSDAGNAGIAGDGMCVILAFYTQKEKSLNEMKIVRKIKS